MAPRMLAGRCVVHGADLELLARRALRDKGWLSPDRDDYAEALAELIAAAWTLSLKWDPGKSKWGTRPGAFANWCLVQLRFRAIDFYRRKYGRSYPGSQASRPQLVSTDTEAGQRALERIVAPRVMDAEEYCGPALRWALAAGDRQSAGDIVGEGFPASHRAQD
jgi:hypothetical protein